MTLSSCAQAKKPTWPADDCYHGCCEGAAKAPGRREASGAAPAKAEKEAVKKDIAKVVEAAAEAVEAKAEGQVTQRREPCACD